VNPHQESTPDNHQPQPEAPDTESPVTDQAPAPVQPAHVNTTSTPADPHQQRDAVTTILQWLTYAFWGWTVLALSILTTAVIASFVNESDTGDFTPYGIAAIIVLLPISFLCDYFYSKREPQKKTGVDLVIMVIHAVLFALFCIGSLIVAVVSLVQMFVSSTGSEDTQVVLLSALVITFFYALTFLRTLNPAFAPWTQRFYKLIMVILITIIAILGIVGPVAKERSNRDDKLITSALPDVEEAISRYARANDKLPASLTDLEATGDAARLIDTGLVTYKPQGKVEVSKTSNTYLGTNYQEPAYKYELCATYKKASKDYGRYDSYENSARSSNEYTTYLSTYDHPKGTTCYKLRTSEY
jgi:competence protein ComGC